MTISKVEKKTKDMLDYATQLHWLHILYQAEAINSDEFIRIKKVLVAKFGRQL